MDNKTIKIMETLNNLEILTIVSFAAPFFLIALLAIFYIITLRSDNSYLRKCLTKNKEAMQEERKLHKQYISESDQRIKNLQNQVRESYAVVNQGADRIIGIERPIRTLQYSLKEFRTETEASKQSGLKALYSTIGEQVFKAAKVERFQEYGSYDWVNDIEIKVLDLKD